MLAPPSVQERRREVAWTRDYLADLEADFRAWYGVTDMLSLRGPEFFRLAMRTPAFRGVMRERTKALQDADEAAARQYQAEAVSSQAGPSSVSAAGVREVPGTREALAASSTFSGLIDIEGG